MILQAVSIYDRKAKIYSQPVLVPHVAAAVRSFGDAVNTSGSEYNKHPEDYIIFHVGAFDDNTGVFTKLDQHVELANALALHLPS